MGAGPGRQLPGLAGELPDERGRHRLQLGLPGRSGCPEPTKGGRRSAGYQQPLPVQPLAALRKDACYAVRPIGYLFVHLFNVLCWSLSTIFFFEKKVFLKKKKKKKKKKK